MRCLVLFPPQWIPFSPHLAGPVIHSIIKNSGHEVKLLDLNAEFYNTVLTPQFLFSAVKSAFSDFESNAAKLFQECPDEAHLKNHPQDFQNRYKRYQEIFKMAKRDEYREIIKQIESAIAVLRDRNKFYDPEIADQALSIINKACGILSATHYPSNVYFLMPNVKIYYDVPSLMEDCENAQGNIFRSFFESRIEALLKDAPQFIGISIGDYSQMLPGLTLAMLLKKATKAHICIGGNLFGRYTDVLVNNPEFFKLFANFVIFNEGERPVVELLKHLDGQISINSVPNLIYLKSDNQIAINEEAPPLPVTELFPPEFVDLSPSNYFLPEIIYSLQASRSCYWKRCSFCTHHAGSHYAIKPVANTIDEIKTLQASQGARYFHFIDEAISPLYLRKLSEAIIKEGLDINFYIYARFEKAFDQELFDVAQQAGLRMILWGFEAASERIYKLMNKGHIADKNKRLRILEDAYNAGIWNFLFLMFDFPTETLSEAKETVDFSKDYRHILSHGTGSTFMLLGDSPMLKNLSKYSITDVQKIRNGFNFAHKYTASCGMTKEQKQELDSYKLKNWRLAEMKYRGSSFREKLFLYVCKHGVESVSEMNRNFWL